MSPDKPLACDACLARSSLLALLSARLDHVRTDLDGLLSLLALTPPELIEAIGRRRRYQLQEHYEALLTAPSPAAPRSHSLCPHVCQRLPVPYALHFSGASTQLLHALEQPLVAIVGSRSPSEHGRQLAYDLGALLATAEIQLVTPMLEGISAAAHSGALSQQGSPVAVLTGGVDIRQPSYLTSQYRRLASHGWLVSELPAGLHRRRWTIKASCLLSISLAQLLVIVEGESDGIETQLGSYGLSHGVTVLAMPGRIGSARSGGPLQLLRQGAQPLLCLQDVLDALDPVVAPHALTPSSSSSINRLDQCQRDLLRRIEAGDDTIAKLAGSPETAETLLALGELEALRLVHRVASGRYVPALAIAR